MDSCWERRSVKVVVGLYDRFPATEKRRNAKVLRIARGIQRPFVMKVIP